MYSIDFDKAKYLKTLKKIQNQNINTICIEANCPNRYECFSKNTATFLVLGKTCTRNCKYCNVKKGLVGETFDDEAENILNSIEQMNLNYVVLTQVTRDDLEDSGASYIANLITMIKNKFPEVFVEVLISDLKGNLNDLKTILDAKPDVLNHNIEVVERLFPTLREKGSYDWSLKILKATKNIDPYIKVKSGMMVGLSENFVEIKKTFEDLKECGVDIVTVGQYLRPNKECEKVLKMYEEHEYEKIINLGNEIGFSKTIAGKYVRSSYNAKELFNEN